VNIVTFCDLNIEIYSQSVSLKLPIFRWYSDRTQTVIPRLLLFWSVYDRTRIWKGGEMAGVDVDEELL